MKRLRLSKQEMRVMEILWNKGLCSIREVQEGFPERRRPAYTTVQTTVYRLERKKAVRRVKKIGNAHMFEAAISRNAAQKNLIEELLVFFEGRAQPIVAHLIESGNLSIEDMREAEKFLKDLEKKAPLQ